MYMYTCTYALVRSYYAADMYKVCMVFYTFYEQLQSSVLWLHVDVKFIHVSCLVTFNTSVAMRNRTAFALAGLVLSCHAFQLPHTHIHMHIHTHAHTHLCPIFMMYAHVHVHAHMQMSCTYIHTHLLVHYAMEMYMFPA